MKRRTRALLAGIALAVAGAVIGTLVATGLGGSDTASPTGAETVLRIQPADEEVSCGAGPAPVYIYLDDLEARPSPRQAGVSYGVAGFEFFLRYDPKTVRIANPIDVQLNSQLDQEDADRDGVARSFLIVSDIDDYAGLAALGGVSFVPSSRRVEDNNEEGPDPVARGEPLLLMTVRFLPVGHGTTTLTLSDPGNTMLPREGQPGVWDPSIGSYEPLVLREATLTVKGGDCPEPPPATPRPTVRPTATPYVPPTIAIPTPVLVTPTPAIEAGRADCPRDWAAYTDPDGHFSLCYPPDWKAIIAPPQADFGTTLSLTWNYSLLTVYWKASSYFDAPDFQDRCALAPEWRDKQQVNLTMAGRTAAACVGYEELRPPDAPPLLATFAEIPLGPGKGYVVLFSTQPEGLSLEDPANGFRLLDSLKFE